MSTKESILDMKIDLSKIIENRLVKIILNILFGFSIASLNFILIEQKFSDTYTYIFLPIISFFIAEIFAFKFQFLSKTFKDSKKSILIISIVLGIFTTTHLCRNMEYIEYINIVKIASIIAIPSVIILLYWFYNKLIDYFKAYVKSLDKVEKYFLIIAGLILIISIVIIYNLTSVFSNIVTAEEEYNYSVRYEKESPEVKEKVYQFIKQLYKTNQYDTIFTSDTGPIIYQDVYINIVSNQNDVKQPLFGVFALPFVLLARMTADIFPNIDNLYVILIAIIQGMLALISFTLIARLMSLKKNTKILFLVTMLLSYPSLLFLINLEQYIITLFYLIAYIYFCVKGQKEDKDMLYIAATGCSLTSGILFPLLCEKNNIKQSIKNVFITFLKCMAVLIISARIILIFPNAAEEQIGWIKVFSDVKESTYNYKFNLYTNFVQNTMYFTEFEEEERVAASKMLKIGDNSALCLIKMPSIKQINTNQISIVGITIMIIATLGFIMNRKDKFSQIAFSWISFSLALLVCMGWGIKENGLILYTFYFSWAFICLIYKFFEKILHKFENTKNTLYALIIMSMLTINLLGIYEIIQFGIKYFRW